MSIEIFKHSDRPDEFAVSKAGASTAGSVFFLNFSRPINIHRWFGVHNNWIGIAVGLLVPVIHEGDEEGGYGIRRRGGCGCWAENYGRLCQSFPRRLLINLCFA